MTNGEQMAKILADTLGGCPILDPCTKIWTSEGWCKDHCKPGQQEPDAECWLKYAEAMVEEAENSTESSLTQKALDTISRQAAIDAILAVTGNSSVRELYEHVQEHGLSDMWSGGVNAAIDIIIALPSAQPKPCEDAVSRADVLESFADLYDTFEDCSKGIINELHRKFEDLRTLPSAQPDRCDTCRFVYYPKETNDNDQ